MAGSALTFSDRLTTGQRLAANDLLVSSNGQFLFFLLDVGESQDTGGMYVLAIDPSTKKTSIRWNSHTGGWLHPHVEITGIGFNVVDAAGVEWNAPTVAEQDMRERGGATHHNVLVMQDDGDLVLYDAFGNKAFSSDDDTAFYLAATKQRRETFEDFKSWFGYFKDVGYAVVAILTIVNPAAGAAAGAVIGAADYYVGQQIDQLQQQIDAERKKAGEQQQKEIDSVLSNPGGAVNPNSGGNPGAPGNGAGGSKPPSSSGEKALGLGALLALLIL